VLFRSEVGLDLVEIQADQRPPLCKIMDYGKYKYDLSKKQQRSRAASKQAEMKEVRLGRSAKIDIHDVGIRVNQARRFLMEGHKVLLVQQFRGREMAHREIGLDRLRKICDDLEDVSKVEVPPKLMGRRMSLILSPDKTKIEKIKRKLAKSKADAEAEKAAIKAQLAEERELDSQMDADVEPDDAVLDAAETELEGAVETEAQVDETADTEPPEAVETEVQVDETADTETPEAVETQNKS